MYINDLSYYEDKVLDCFGDSTTWGDNGVHTGSNKISWVHGFQHLIPFAEVRNYGIKGSRIADCADRDDSFAKRVKKLRLKTPTTWLFSVALTTSSTLYRWVNSPSIMLTPILSMGLTTLFCVTY